MESPVEDSSEWRYTPDEIEPGDSYSFRYRWPGSGTWIEATDPLAYRYSQHFDQETQRYDLYAIVPRRSTAGIAPAPRQLQGLRVCECTLPGLAARWLPAATGPISATTTGPSLAARLLGNGLPQRLRERNYSAIMLPIQASAADIEHYNWKFGYLITGLGAIHHQFGDWHELRALVDEFHSAGVLVIPDLILVHYADRTSDRAPYAIRDPQGQMLWFDHSAHRPIDFGTYMLRWEDEYVRRSVADLLVRFVDELGVGAFRFDFVDGVVRQYESRDTNFGALLLDEIGRKLADRGLDACCLSEAFATREHPAVLNFADVLYQPWVGFDCIKAALTTPDDGTTWRFGKVGEGLIGATGSRQPKPTLGYALAHDEAGRDEGVLNNHRNDRGEIVSVGGHLAQLVLDYVQRLPEGLAPDRAQTLAFVADRTALIEGTALFGADFAQLSLGGFSDFLKLGSYDDPDGWQTVWSVDHHPDLDRWCAATGLPPDAVRTQIAAHADRMTRLRGIFAQYTPLGESPRRPLIENVVLAHQASGATIAWARRVPTDRGQSLIVIAQFGHQGGERIALQLPSDLSRAWEVVDSSTSPNKWPSQGSRVEADSSGRITLDVAANTLVVLCATT